MRRGTRKSGPRKIRSGIHIVEFVVRDLAQSEEVDSHGIDQSDDG